MSSNEKRLRKVQRDALKPGEVEGIGFGHTEVTIVNAAIEMGLTPIGTAASRPICTACAEALQKQSIVPLSKLKDGK